LPYIFEHEKFVGLALIKSVFSPVIYIGVLSLQIKVESPDG